MSGSPNDKLVVMISSSVRDLPEHREKVMHACLRQSLFPSMMEHLPSSDDDAIAESFRMVDEADIFLGVFAHRYGEVSEGHDLSITEMEVNRAVERGIPRLLFLMGEDHPVKAKDVDKGEGAVKLEALRERLRAERVVNFFNSGDELLAQAIHALGAAKAEIAERVAQEAEAEGREVVPKAYRFHYVSDIPAPPEPYIAHPYTLLQTRGLIGRQRELNLLTDWITRPETMGHAHVMNVVAIGGMGKSALTWHWFQEIAAQEMSPLAGRIWWSFYESDATLENFITRALAYVSGRSREEVAALPTPDREQELLAILDAEPFVVALDGLERILIAYARMDAAYLQDTDMDDRTANVVAGAIGLPMSAGQSFVGRHQLRKTADPRAGQFLRKLARVRSSRILISTRLYPADLQTDTGQPWPGCNALFLPGLSDEDTLDLWRAHGARGSREVMLPVFRSFDRHPLLLQILASEVAHYREAPGDFDAWRQANPDFDPFALPLVQVQSHVLAVALRGLTAAERRTLHVIAGFRLPTGIETLEALLIRTADDSAENKPFTTFAELDATLSVLEDRGLLGWDQRANRYDLHPIVRGVTWSALGDDAKADIYGTLQVHFEAIPKIDDYTEVESLEDLTPAIELYNTLIGLGLYDEACMAFRDRLDEATHFRLSVSRQRVEMLERLFPDGLDALPRLSQPARQSWTLNALAQGHHLSGQPGSAVLLLRTADEIDLHEGYKKLRSVGLCNLSDTLRCSGGLRSAESSARSALLIGRGQDFSYSHKMSLFLLGQALAARGETGGAQAAFQRSLLLFTSRSNRQGKGFVNALLAERALWMSDPATARALADCAWELAGVRRLEADFIRAARLQGTAALLVGEVATADERLHHALKRARACQLVQEELPALIALAELEGQRGAPERARELLGEVWEAAERGPYPLFHADALNVLAQLELDAGDSAKAIAAARRAFELAWCDGPPFAYHWGLVKAKAHLVELGAPEPVLEPFDESKFEPMPEVEIDPPDKFGADGEAS